MHLAEGVLPFGQAIAWSALAAPTVYWSLRGEQRARRDTPSSSVIMAGVTSLLFAGTLLPLPVPVVGATSHICLTPVLALIVGVRRIVWPTFFVLLLQAVFFAHGGLTTLGVNTLTPWPTGAADGCRSVGPAPAAGDRRDGRPRGRVWRRGPERVRRGRGGAGGRVVRGDGAGDDFRRRAARICARPSTLGDSRGRRLRGHRAAIVFASARPFARVAASPSRRGLRPPRRSLVLVSMGGLAGCGYEGIDGTVFGAIADEAGRPPQQSVVDLSQGELGLATSIVILFGLGFVAGRTWERLLGERRDALPR